jgi:hypothetical protein
MPRVEGKSLLFPLACIPLFRLPSPSNVPEVAGQSQGLPFPGGGPFPGPCELGILVHY